MSKKTLVKSTGVIGSATAISRILGFVRDIVIARFFGTAVYAQAFVVAFRIPNLLRDLIGEGAMNAAFVPVLTDELTKKGKADFLRLAQVLLNILFLVLCILTLIGIIASPVIVRLIAPGFIADPEKFEATVSLTRILFPFLILVGLWAYAMGVLNSLGVFAAPAFGPSILNLSMILCAMWFGENVLGLATGVLAGGVLQVFIQLPPLYAHGWKVKLTKEFSHPRAKEAGLLLIPRAMGACVYQINVFVSTILASLSAIAGEGAVAALYYANRIWQLPLAIFGIALAQAALPAMSRHVAANDTAKLKETLFFSLNALFFMLVPATAGLMVLSKPITRILFERGAFNSYSTVITSQALFYYASGLAAYGGIKILVSAFYSMKDTVTPVKTAFASLVINVVFNLILMYPMKVGGLALATSIAAAVNFIMLYALLVKRLGDFRTKDILNSFLRVLCASVVMAVALIILSSLVRYNIFTLIAAIILAIIIFLLAAHIFNVRELRELLAWIAKKR